MKESSYKSSDTEVRAHEKLVSLIVVVFTLNTNKGIKVINKIFRQCFVSFKRVARLTSMYS